MDVPEDRMGGIITRMKDEGGRWKEVRSEK
jgi:hypothetical protein